MARDIGKFTITFSDLDVTSTMLERDGIFIGRLDTCEVVLDHPAVSRIHAGISYADGKYTLVNLSTSNVLTLNGRLLPAQKSDVIADGDVIQIGPFTLTAGRLDRELLLIVEKQFIDTLPEPEKRPVDRQPADEADGVLDVFWEKRSREKEDWGTRLRPTALPRPGKAMYNWRPTRDLRRPWRVGLFVWAILIVGAVGAFAFFKYPQTYEPKPLSNPHASVIDGSPIAAASNGNSCTTCHTTNEPIENACIKCHQANEFHASNTRAHEEAGITCTVCHKEHQGADHQITAEAIQSCAQCHNDSNKNSYNGKQVHTAHGGSYGYPVIDGVWKWKGVYREVADAIPEISSSATGDRDEQTKLSRYFHTIHVGRLKAPQPLHADKRGLVSCGTCHNSFDPIDRATPKQTCAVCHTNGQDSIGRDARFASSNVNCISCHVQHAYSARRWNEFLTGDAVDRRKDAVAAKIEALNGK